MLYVRDIIGNTNKLLATGRRNITFFNGCLKIQQQKGAPWTRQKYCAQGRSKKSKVNRT